MSFIKFISFAVWWMRSKLGNYIERTDFIRIPSVKRNAMLKKLKEQETSAFNSDEYQLWQIFTGYTSIDKQIGDADDNSTLMDVLEDTNNLTKDKEIEAKECRQTIMNILDDTLDQDEYKIITGLFGLETDRMTFEDLSVPNGKSKQWVKTVRNRALKKLNLCQGIKELKT